MDNVCLSCGHPKSEHKSTKITECKHGNGCDCFEYDYGQFNKIME